MGERVFHGHAIVEEGFGQEGSGEYPLLSFMICLSIVISLLIMRDIYWGS
jgi:hypothetical protein